MCAISTATHFAPNATWLFGPVRRIGCARVSHSQESLCFMPEQFRKSLQDFGSLPPQRKNHDIVQPFVCGVCRMGSLRYQKTGPNRVAVNRRRYMLKRFCLLLTSCISFHAPAIRRPSCDCHYPTDCRGRTAMCRVGAGCLRTGKNDGTCAIGVSPASLPVGLYC